MGSGNGHVCRHCFVSTSPCWRKGPEDKPILCNACGARYLVKRSLVGYFPKNFAVKKEGLGGQRTGHSGRPGCVQVKRSAGGGSKGKRKAARGTTSPSPCCPPSPGSRSKGVTSTSADNGTQPGLAHVPLFLPSGHLPSSLPCQEAPSLFTLSPSKHIKAMSEEDFNSFAVSALTLLRHSDSNSDSAEDGVRVSTPVVRRPRKGSEPIRALF